MKKNGKNPEEINNISSMQGEDRDIKNDELLPGLPGGDFLKRGTSRRDFLKVLGFSFASAAIIESCKRPVQYALPYVIQPPEITPGKALYYASTFYDGHESVSYTHLTLPTKRIA